MSSVSRERSGRRTTDRPSASAASTRARFVTLLLPGSGTTACSGPAARGAGQGSGGAAALAVGVMWTCSSGGAAGRVDPARPVRRAAVRGWARVRPLRLQPGRPRPRRRLRGRGAAGAGAPPSWNVAPTDPVYAVLARGGTRSLRVLRWGLVPSWAKDAKGAARLINARSETADQQAGLPVGVRPAPVPRARRRLLRVAARRARPSSRGSSPPATARRSRWPGCTRCGPARTASGSGRAPSSRPTPPTSSAHPRPDAAARAARDWGRVARPGGRGPGQDLLVPATPGVLDAWPVSPAVGQRAHERPGAGGAAAAVARR
jgi:hypothetical protein